MKIPKSSSPIKRADALKALSRDHYNGLLLCWKIRQGIKLNVSYERIKQYNDWFWKTHLEHHFLIEEKVVFTILDDSNENVKRAKSEHKRLKKYFEDTNDIIKSINLIEEELEKHIRFEERILFNEIQQIASPEQLKTISDAHNELFIDDWEDKFWKT